MNPPVILALISDLYSQISELAQENQHLRDELARREGRKPSAPDDHDMEPRTFG